MANRCRVDVVAPLIDKHGPETARHVRVGSIKKSAPAQWRAEANLRSPIRGQGRVPEVGFSALNVASADLINQPAGDSFPEQILVPRHGLHDYFSAHMPVRRAL